MLREITGIGKGFYIAIGDGFAGIASWANYLPDSDRIILDSHPYFAFDGSPNDQPISVTGPDGRVGGIWPQQACSAWASLFVDRYVCTYFVIPLKLLCRWSFRILYGLSLTLVAIAANRRLASTSPENSATGSTTARFGFVEL